MSKGNRGVPRVSSKQKLIEKLDKLLGEEKAAKVAAQLTLEHECGENKLLIDRLNQANKKIEQLDYDCAAKQIQLANMMNEKSNHVAIIASQADSISRLSNTILKMVERINERDGE